MNRVVYRLGYWSGMIAFASTMAYLFVQILQVIEVFHYPLDETLIYGTSLCIVIPFLLEILSLHYITPVEKRLWSHAAIVFATIYSVFVIANYVVQLATVIPMTQKGFQDEIQVLKQTPHSMFWNFDAIGYIFMGFTTLIASPIFDSNGFQRWVKLFFIANGLVTVLISTVYFYPEFSEKLLFLFGSPWGITAPGSMLLLAILFRKKIELR